MQSWAGNLLFNIPAQQFTNRITAFEYLDKDSRLGAQLLEAKNGTAYVRYFENYLLEKVQSVAVDPVSSLIAQSIRQTSSMQQFQGITEKLGYSKRRIEQRF